MIIRYTVLMKHGAMVNEHNWTGAETAEEDYGLRIFLERNALLVVIVAVMVIVVTLGWPEGAGIFERTGEVLRGAAQAR